MKIILAEILLILAELVWGAYAPAQTVTERQANVKGHSRCGC